MTGTASVRGTTFPAWASKARTPLLPLVHGAQRLEPTSDNRACGLCLLAMWRCATQSKLEILQVGP